MTNQILGYIAGLFTMFAFIPQIIKMNKTKSSKDVSVLTILQLFIGTLLWCIYSIINKDIPLLLNNVIACILSMVALYLYYKYINTEPIIKDHRSLTSRKQGLDLLLKSVKDKKSKVKLDHYPDESYFKLIKEIND